MTIDLYFACSRGFWKKKGYAVAAAETGRDALCRFGQQKFDAALIDVRLPDVNGTDLLPEIKKLSPKTVRIVFTGSPDSEGLVNGNKNMDAFLIKPVKPELLLSLLEEKLVK
jgi:DNA-binding NtrC family response regulator